MKFGRSGKGSFTEKNRIVNRGYLCGTRESACSKLQYGPNLISVACSLAKLSILGTTWKIRAKIVNRGSLWIVRESTCSKFQYDPYLISVPCPKTELFVLGKFWEIR